MPSPRRSGRRGGARDRSRPRWLLLAAVVLALSGCLQEAHDADKSFTFDNPVDPTTTSTTSVFIALVAPGTNIALIINNSGASQDMTGWTLVDQTGPQTFTFPAFTLGINSYVRVNKAVGAPTSVDLYSSGITWNNTETATLNTAVPTEVWRCVVGSGC